jgi:hypothetical protein
LSFQTFFKFTKVYHLKFSSKKISGNGWRANEGRETKALNCKPITNLKEKSELSNYCKPAVFVCTLLVVGA